MGDTTTNQSEIGYQSKVAEPTIGQVIQGVELDSRLSQEVRGTAGKACGEVITFHPVKSGRDKGLWACGICHVAFVDDWMIKHVNWHYQTKRLRR
jgi:hypothetical protein